MSKCLGCGITLQNENKEKVGYTKNLDNKYCERCFRTIHYNEYKKVDNINNEDIIKRINKLNMFTIFITDLLSINQKLIDNFKSITNDKVLVVNKCDIIPDNLKLEHLEENIKTSFNLKDNVFFISSKKNLYLDRIVNIIELHEKVVFCGETSSGKSTLINKLLDTNLTTSKYSNTTLDFIKLKMGEFLIYDTPGLIINENKMNIDKINVWTKHLSEDYVLEINDLKLKGNGYITCFLDSNVKVNSKKDNTLFEYNKVIKNNSDIELENGFIFCKNEIEIKSNKPLSVRCSIIGK